MVTTVYNIPQHYTLITVLQTHASPLVHLGLMWTTKTQYLIAIWPGTCISVDNLISVWASKS